MGTSCYIRCCVTSGWRVFTWLIPGACGYKQMGQAAEMTYWVVCQNQMDSRSTFNNQKITP